MTSADTHPFQKQLAERPFDVELRLVYADWLEERGMASAAERLRARCAHRQALSTKELKELAGRDAGRHVDESMLPAVIVQQDLGVRQQEALQNMSCASLARNFPRDGAGNLSLGTTIVLGNFGPLGRRDQLLTAVGPQRRKDPQRVRIEQTTGYCMHFDHDWSKRRNWWTTETFANDCWVNEEAQLTKQSELGNPDCRNQLEAKARAGALNEIERQALIIHRLDAGAFEDALALAGVSMSEELSRMLDAEEFPLPVGSDWRFDAPNVARRRAMALRQALWESSPWSFEQAIETHQDRVNERRKRHTTEPLYLYIIPGQSTSRRARVSLVRERGKPHLTMVASGSNVRPWRWTWTRPPWFDANRWRLAASS